MLPPVATNFIAGEEPATAFDHTRRMNRDGVGVILNLLGEHYEDRSAAADDRRSYEQVIRDIASSDLRACVSVKPSQLGIDVGPDTFEDNYRSLVETGQEAGVFVWCDMEDATTTDTTLDAFESVAREHGGGVGLCVQSNLRRTHDDIQRLVDVPGKIRLVKGAYDEGPELAYPNKSSVNEAYRTDLETLFANRDGGVGVGSHDPEMISYARELGERHGTDFEVQMLMGVREEAQRELAAEGVDVWQYAPYGSKWLSYFYRRVRERKENLLFAARAVVGV